MEDWRYAIKPYKRAANDFGWTPASEAEATVWFGFRERGEDRRCFGVFESRADAEGAVEKLKGQELKQAIRGGMRL